MSCFLRLDCPSLYMYVFVCRWEESSKGLWTFSESGVGWAVPAHVGRSRWLAKVYTCMGTNSCTLRDYPPQSSSHLMSSLSHQSAKSHLNSSLGKAHGLEPFTRRSKQSHVDTGRTPISDTRAVKSLLYLGLFPVLDRCHKIYIMMELRYCNVT